MLSDNLLIGILSATLVILVLIVSVVIIIFIARRQRIRQQLSEAIYRAKMTDITLGALRAQMNPHFIFNCLNSIKLYTEQNNSVAASEYLTKFSKLIRNMLDSSRTEKTSLTVEMETLRLYLDMEGMRFKEKMQYELIVDRSIDADFIDVPPLLIQPYVENAIWHGIMHQIHGGKIIICVSQSKEQNELVITVEDNGIGRAKAGSLKSNVGVEQKSHGTRITSERIDLLNEKSKGSAFVLITDLHNAKGEASGTLVTIKLAIK